MVMVMVINSAYTGPLPRYIPLVSCSSSAVLQLRSVMPRCLERVNLCSSSALPTSTSPVKSSQVSPLT